MYLASTAPSSIDNADTESQQDIKSESQQDIDIVYYRRYNIDNLHV
jgi:hypothetical protein